MLRLLSDAVSRNVERLSYAQRLHTRKLVRRISPPPFLTNLPSFQISSLPTDSHPTGYIVSNAEDLLSLFDADFGVLVVGEGAKILGPNQHGTANSSSAAPFSTNWPQEDELTILPSGQEILILAEYLRLKQFEWVFFLSMFCFFGCVY